MKTFAVGLVACLAILLPAGPAAQAETHTISWNAVNTYTDGTPIEAGRTVTYVPYWTTDSGLPAGSLRTIVPSTAQTSATFDPDLQGMVRGATIYFTAKTVLDMGEESALSPPYTWIDPQLPTTPVTLSSISVGGPSSLNEGETGKYTATATWSDGTTTTVTPTWTEDSSYASISTDGVLTTSMVPSDQTLTLTATFKSGDETRTGTKKVTLVNVAANVPKAPENVHISGPIRSGLKNIWRLTWDPVGTNVDGSPLDGGRTVRYTSLLDL